MWYFLIEVIKSPILLTISGCFSKENPEFICNDDKGQAFCGKKLRKRSLLRVSEATVGFP